jgi:hypothetical protein
LVRFLSALFEPQDRIVVRPIEVWVDAGTGKKCSRVIYRAVRHPTRQRLLESGFFNVALRIAEVQRANLFFGVCPRVGGDGQYDLAWQVRTVRVLWADLDHCTPEEALARCAAAGLPRPSVVVSSGNGVHLYWLLEEPYLIDDAGGPPPAVFKEFFDQGDGRKRKVRKYVKDPKTGERVYLRSEVDRSGKVMELSPKARHAQDVLAGIAAKVRGDHTKDLARMLRLPCTLNRKDERNGKSPVPCELVECEPDRRYPFTDFEPFAEAAPERVEEKEAAKVRLPKARTLTPDRLNKLAHYINRSALAEVGGRSEPDFGLCCYAIEQGYDKERIWEEVQGVGKFAERGREYFDRTWAKAEEKVRLKVYHRVRRQAGGTPDASARANGNGHTGADGRGTGQGDGAGPPGQGRAAAPQGDAAGGLPTILGNMRQLRDVTADALAAVKARDDPPTVFQRGGVLTRLKVNAGTGAPQLEALGGAALRGVLARVADWKKGKDAKHGTSYEDDAPPLEVVQDLANLPAWEGIHVIEALAECPVFSRTGELVAAPGFHAGARLWLQPAPGLDVPPVSPRPTREEVDEARAWLLVELYGDFPFADKASPAHALAALLLPFVRLMIDGPTPLHLFDAPTEGTGKTLLADCVFVVNTGRESEATPEPKEEEWRKLILALLMEGPPVILLDNLNHTLDSGALASALTSVTCKGRVLGVSKTAAVPNLATWIASGNNTRLSRELIRRTLWCRIDAAMDSPSERKNFRHPNLLRWAKVNRGRLVWAALTVCQAWVAAGRPAGKHKLGKFESWAEAMGGILDVAGVPGLLANADAFRKARADIAGEWRTFVQKWWDRHNTSPVGVAELFVLAQEYSLLDSVLGDGKDRSQRTRLGTALVRMVDRVFGNLQIVSAGDDHSTCRLYKLREVTADTPSAKATPPLDTCSPNDEEEAPCHF